jgi:hypothetical protein
MTELVRSGRSPEELAQENLNRRRSRSETVSAEESAMPAGVAAA